MIRIVRFPDSRPHIWIDDVSEFVVDGSNGVLRFDGAEHKFRRIQMPYVTKMVTYETHNPYDDYDVRKKHNYREYTVQLLQVDQGEDTSQGEWDEELGGYLVLTPTCKQTLYFRIVDEPETVTEACDVLSIGGCSDREEMDDDGVFVPLE
jgi:hypothetical protein